MACLENLSTHSSGWNQMITFGVASDKLFIKITHFSLISMIQHLHVDGMYVAQNDRRINSCGLVTPYGAKILANVDREWPCPAGNLRCQTMTWTIVDFPSVKSNYIHLSASLWIILHPSIAITSLKIFRLNVNLNYPGANGSIRWRKIFLINTLGPHESYSFPSKTTKQNVCLFAQNIPTHKLEKFVM